MHVAKFHQRPPKRFSIHVEAKSGGIYKDSNLRVDSFGEAVAEARRRARGTGRNHYVYFGSILLYRCSKSLDQFPLIPADAPPQFVAAIYDSDYEQVANQQARRTTV